MTAPSPPLLPVFQRKRKGEVDRGGGVDVSSRGGPLGLISDGRELSGRCDGGRFMKREARRGGGKGKKERKGTVVSKRP